MTVGASMFYKFLAAREHIDHKAAWRGHHKGFLRETRREDMGGIGKSIVLLI
jgi:hypothetical protein